ncbi:3-oxoadipate enol-lactonase [soil metagenome]
MASHQLDINGESLLVREAGQPGQPVVFFFHSLGLSSELWAPQFAAFQGNCRLIAMDCRGHGGSSNRGGFSVSACADDALAVLHAMGVTRAHVVGVSMGGLMTAELAVRMKAAGLHCESMVLACSYRFAGGPHVQARIDQAAAMIKDKGMAQFGRLYMDGTACYAMGDATREHMAGIIAAMQPGDYLQTLTSILTHDAGSAFARVSDVPALVLSGRLDARVSPAVLVDLKSAVPQASAVELEEAGHLANIEDPDGFNRALRRFWYF